MLLQCAVVAVVSGIVAQPAVRDLAPVIEPIAGKHSIVGMGAAIVNGANIVGIGVVGLRALDAEEAVTAADAWHLGSCTKAMTATLAAVHVQRGTLTWETTIGEVFHEVEMNEAWRTVTLDQLVHNRSGMPTDLSRDGLWQSLWIHGGTPAEQRMALVRGVLAWKPAAAPGSKFIYSNAGFAVAGVMLERKTGKAWEDLMQEDLFKPLGISGAGFGAPGDAGTMDHIRGHKKGRPVPPGPGSDNPAAIGPAGTVHMSIGEWAKFISAHVIGERGESPLLPAESFRWLHEPTPDPRTEYAAGWVVMSRPWAKGDKAGDTGRVLMHNGSNTSWYCVTWLAPERNFAALVTCNQGDGSAEKACDEAASELLKNHIESLNAK